MDDLISRQAAIKEIYDLPNCYNGYSDTYDKAYIIGVLEELPTAEKKGKWIDHEVLGYLECSECHMEWSRITNRVEFFRYCPNCGAKMEKS